MKKMIFNENYHCWVSSTSSSCEVHFIFTGITSFGIRNLFHMTLRSQGGKYLLYIFLSLKSYLIIWSKIGKMRSGRQLASSKVMQTLLLMYFLLMLSVPSIAVSVSPHRPFPKGIPTERANEMLVKLRMNGATPKLVSIYNSSIHKSMESLQEIFRVNNISLHTYTYYRMVS